MSTKKAEVQAKEPVVTSEVETADLMDLAHYLEEVAVHPGLIASFKYEASQDPKLLVPKTKDGWDKAFADQSNKIYE